MDEKKPIDRLFQEKLKDFEVFPEANVWKNIEQELTRKRRRRIVPLWLRLGSAAAVLLLLISTGFWFFDQEQPNEVSPISEPTVIEQNTNTPQQLNKDEPQTTDSTPKIRKSDQIEPSPSVVARSNKASKASQNQDPITENKTKESGTAEAVKNEQLLTDATQQRESKAEANTKNLLDSDKKAEQIVDNVSSDDPTPNKDLKITKEDIANAIEDQLNEPIENDPSLNRWSVGTAVAPVYFNTLNEGSPINPSLAGNEKQGNTSLSYGLRVNYQINDRLSLQSGVNNVELGYETQGVTALIASSELRLFDSNIDTNIDGVNLIAISNNDVAAQTSELGAQRGVVNLRGDLSQSLSYIEIPLEAKYALINNKVGVHVVGGVSTYVLYQNRIALLDQNGSTTLGEASNVNDVNFTGNLGIDLDYKINKKVFINITPMFKYQMNTFSRNDGGFRPYYLGVYTGLNFRF